MIGRRARASLAFFAAAIAATIVDGCNGPGICVHGANWKYKIGTDAQAKEIARRRVPTTIDALRALPHVDRAKDGSRAPSAELTTWEVRDVEIIGFQRAPDGDVHLEIADAHGHTMIAEAAPPFCAGGSPWRREIETVRALVDDEIPNAVIGWRRRTVSLAGVGYFDFQHGQFGVAPNGIELHPVLAICFGRGCALPE